MSKLKKLDDYLPYGKHYVTNDDILAVQKVLRSNWLTQGPTVREFEKALEDYIGVKHVTLLNSGTAALQLAYQSTQMNSESHLVTTPLTFVATVNAAYYCNASVELVDIDPETWNIDPEQVKDKNFTHLAPVDFAGNPVELEELRKISDDTNAKIVEDASHALGAQYRGDRIGSKFSDATTFSFHPVKHIAMGEGGAIATNDDQIKDELDILITHGITKSNLVEDVDIETKPYYYEQQVLSYNFRVPDTSAALGLSQLSRIEENIEKRNQLADLYKDLVNDWGEASFQHVDEKDVNAYHIFPIKFHGIGIKDRDKIFSELRKLNVGVQVHYIPVHLQPYHKKLGRNVNLENTMDYYENCMTLPLFPELSEELAKTSFEYLKHLYNQIV